MKTARPHRTGLDMISYKWDFSVIRREYSSWMVWTEYLRLFLDVSTISGRLGEKIRDEGLGVLHRADFAQKRVREATMCRVATPLYMYRCPRGMSLLSSKNI